MRRATWSWAVLLVRLVLAGAVALALLAGCTSGAAPPPASPAAPAPPAGMDRSVPVSVEIPAIGARSTLIPLGIDRDGALETPPVQTPMQAGWFTGAPTPGEVGPAVIVGHVDGNHQLGIFYRLDQLRPGDEVLVRRADGTTPRFVVQRLEQVSKTSFPTEQVYGDTSRPELRLITCGGSFDRSARSYRDNIIAFADLAPEPRPASAEVVGR